MSSCDNTDTNIVDSSTEGSQSESVDESVITSGDHDSDYEPLGKMQKLSNSNESKSGIQHQVHAIINELKNVLLNFAITFQILRPPIIVIETTNDDCIVFPIYDSDTTSLLIKKSSAVTNEANQSNVLALEAQSFEILSLNWDEFLEHELIPLIKLKMCLDIEFKAILRHFVILQPSSQTTSVCESERVENKFANLIIQLPSKYKGGKHVVTLNDSKEEFDFTIKQFAMNFIVLNHDCQHHILPITSGVISCLVYDLNISSTDSCIPKVLNSPGLQEKKATLKRLLTEWMEPGKLIFCLSNEYTQENLSFKNLQSTDMRIAILLKSLSNDCSFQVYLGYLQKILQSDVEGDNFKFNSDKYVVADDLKLERLTDIDEENWVDFSTLDVNLSDEVSLNNCFNDKKPYRSSRANYKDDDRWRRNDDEYIYSKYYRCPVIVCFKNQNLFNNLKGCDANTKIKMFLLLFGKFKKTSRENGLQDQLRSWAFEIASIKNQYYLGRKTTTDSIQQVNVIKIMISFDDLELMQVFFHHHRTLTDEIIPLLISQCDKYGWNLFSDQILDMFDAICRFVIIKKYLKTFISTPSTDPNKLNVFHRIIPLIIKNFIQYRDGIKRLPEVWILAKSIGYDIGDYAKSLPILQMVPVLIKLVSSDKNLMDEIWIDVAKYFDKEMESKVINKPNVSWSRPDASISIECSCLNNLLDFLRNDVQSITFQVYKTHRSHCQRAIRKIGYVTCCATEEKGIGPITVTKTGKCGQDKLDIYNRTVELSTKLHSLLQLQEEKKS